MSMSEAFPDPASPQQPPVQLIDVSDLPESAFDWRDPVWWGNALLICIETATIALLIAAYFYIRRNYADFPPPKIDIHPPIYNTAPMLRWGTANLIVLILSCIPMYITDVFARQRERGSTMVGLVVMTLIAAITCWLRWKEFHGVYFWWNDNAYASCVWVILGTHVLYLLATGIEFLIMWAWIWVHGLDAHHALDVTLCGGYWYWAVAVYVIVYAVIYIAPRVM